MIESAYGSNQPAAESESSPKKEGKQNYRMEAREISNGWIVRESWEEGSGDKRQYKDKETYHEENPLVDKD